MSFSLVRLETPEQMLKLIEVEFSHLKRELRKYPQLLDELDLHQLEDAVKNEIIHQCFKAGVDAGSFGKRFKTYAHKRKWESFSQLLILAEESATSADYDFSRQKNKFRVTYFQWAKNLIADLNRFKLHNKWNWLEVEKVARLLADLEHEG